MGEDRPRVGARRIVSAPKDDSKVDKPSTDVILMERPSILPSVRLKPHIGMLFDDAYTIVGKEIERLRDKVLSGKALGPTDVTKMSKLTESLVRLAREEREQDKREDPSAMSDEELTEQLRLLEKEGS